MRIVYFYQYFSTPKGSWGTRVYEFASEWVKQGHEVFVVTSVYSKSDIKATKFIEDQNFEGIQVKIINVTIDNKQPFLKRIISFLVYALERKCLLNHFCFFELQPSYLCFLMQFVCLVLFKFFSCFDVVDPV